MSYQNIREEELKIKVGQDYFWLYECSKKIGNVDFCVTIHQQDALIFEQESLLWAEAKAGSSDIDKSLTQLILTIGRARTFDRHLPPPYLGAFDADKIAFIPYSDINDIFYQNDFNWNVTPSNHDTKEFKLVYDRVKKILDKEALLYHYHKDDRDLKRFIKDNFVEGKRGTTKIRIDKNNFMVVYNKWLTVVKPTIRVDWDIAKKTGIIDGDFYLADLLSSKNETLKDKLFVLLKTDYYELDRKIDAAGMFQFSRTDFNDKQKAHNQFWNKYERPPREEYWDYIVDRRDLLVPQDVRERKGSYYTPQIWVELSQKYIADVLGEDWQDEYYVWDCAAGTGNLLTGLTNKYHIYASTLDKQDVEVMHDRIDAMNSNSIKGSGSNLLHDHVFQFDFLNDDFSKLPASLKAIIDDEDKHKKLVIYINPPYAEASSYGTESTPQVANETSTFKKHKNIVGAEALNELFAQFFIRVYNEIPNAILASFSKVKYITSGKFIRFRDYLNAEYQKGFICKSDSFDNVKGQFPIGFLIWKLSLRTPYESIETDVIANDKEVKHYWMDGIKNLHTSSVKTIAEWRATFYSLGGVPIGFMIIVGPSMQSNNNTFITNQPAKSYIKKGMVAGIVGGNLMEMSIYFSVRHCIEATWLNDRDEFLYPNNGWQSDTEFQNDCLAFTLFSNNIQSAFGTNHWIPFTEKEVNAREKFESCFMANYISGKLKAQEGDKLFDNHTHRSTALEFSTDATATFDAGKALWRYYHSVPGCNVNASLYDIREHFQGRNPAGKMNNKSSDERYMELITALRDSLKSLAPKIELKVYEYGFLKR